jgi:hypothetical protein
VTKLLLIAALLLIGCSNEKEIGVELYRGMSYKVITRMDGSVIREWVKPQGKGGTKFNNSHQEYVNTLDTVWIDIEEDSIIVNYVSSSLKEYTDTYLVEDGAVY